MTEGFLTGRARKLPAFRLRLSEAVGEVFAMIGSFLSEMRAHVG